MTEACLLMKSNDAEGFSPGSFAAGKRHHPALKGSASRLLMATRGSTRPLPTIFSPAGPLVDYLSITNLARDSFDSGKWSNKLIISRINKSETSVGQAFFSGEVLGINDLRMGLAASGLDRRLGLGKLLDSLRIAPS